ncbi:uncharacterized protein [Miscanthus floridulus]|uniref:uncharacterized protein n=1 Tax=Miscanthus floridulus TaxID=154761 RepID=UPI00345792A9
MTGQEGHSRHSCLFSLCRKLDNDKDRARSLLSLALHSLSSWQAAFANLHCVAPYMLLSPPTSEPPFPGSPSLHTSDPPQPNTMVNVFAAFGFADLCLAFAALDIFTFLDSQCGAGTTTSDQAPLLGSVAELLPPLAAVVVLFVAVALIYHHLMGRRVVAVPVAGAGNGRRSISGLVMFLLCVSAGTLEFIVFGHGQAAGGGGAGHGALGLASLRALPFAATATFFFGMMLIIVSHIRAGREGGGGAVSGDEPIQGPLPPLAKVAAGAAAALVVLMAMALALHGAKY